MAKQTRRRFYVTKKDYIRRKILRYYRMKRNTEIKNAKHIACNTLPRKRYYDYVDALFPKLMKLMVMGMSEEETNKKIQEASIVSLGESGFRTPVFNKDGSLNKAAKKKASSILKLPPIQNAIANKFAEQGMSIEEAFKIHISLMRNDENPNIQLSALNMLYKFVIPAQTQRTISQNLNVHTDLDTFNKQSWSEDIPLTLDAEES